MERSFIALWSPSHGYYYQIMKIVGRTMKMSIKRINTSHFEESKDFAKYKLLRQPFKFAKFTNKISCFVTRRQHFRMSKWYLIISFLQKVYVAFD